MKRTGLIQVYTGAGKGKTSAAVGLAVRARAQGLKVSWISFHKQPQRRIYGEIRLLKKLGVVVRCFARYHALCNLGCSKISKQILRGECLNGITYIYKIFKDAKFDMLILDEINICLRDGYLKEKEIVNVLQSKPQQLELVLTGRGITQNIANIADLVSEIQEVKHPFNKKIKARKGIEY